MPIHDMKCEKCGHEEMDVYKHNTDDSETLCPMCDNPMTKLMGGFNFTMTPGSISKFKRRVGNTIPKEYKTTGGANLYGKPRKH